MKFSRYIIIYQTIYHAIFLTIYYTIFLISLKHMWTKWLKITTVINTATTKMNGDISNFIYISITNMWIKYISILIWLTLSNDLDFIVQTLKIQMNNIVAINVIAFLVIKTFHATSRPTTLYIRLNNPVNANVIALRWERDTFFCCTRVYPPRIS